MPPAEISAFELFFKTYGPWIGMVILFIYFKVWPLIENKVIPAQLRSSEDQRKERARIDEEQRRQKAIIDEEERKFRQDIERERLESARLTQQAIQAISTAMVQTNERIAQILQNQLRIQEREDDILQVLGDGIAEMKERVALREGIDKGKHMPKTGPLEDRKQND